MSTDVMTTDTLIDDGTVALQYRVSGKWVVVTLLFWLAASIVAAFTVIVPLIGVVLMIRALVLKMSQDVVLEADSLTLRWGSFTTHEQTLPLRSIQAITTSTGPLGDWLDYSTITFSVGNDRTVIKIENLAECQDLRRRVRERAAAQGVHL